ncbi:MAG TPA: hypothetical protein VF715_11390 [Thermoleophilaceae bacterium]|jgi:hypothetical protein
MPADGAYPVEDFLDAIASQLDRMQDSLRLKAVNRPLTYAVRDFSLELQVFIDLDSEGRVRFRNSAPNETGASTVRVEFTTITRPMIEENTVELAMTKSPSLDEAGLAPEERRQLERVGVRNIAQLKKLGNSADASTVARFSGVPIDRLRQAIAAGRPKVTAARPAPAEPNGAGAAPPPAPPPPAQRLPVEPPRVEPPPAAQPPRVEPPRTDGGHASRRPGDGFRRPIAQGLGEAASAGAAVPLAVAAGTRALELSGENLAGPDHPVARLDGAELPVLAAEDDRIVVELPQGSPGGRLELDLGDGEVLSYDLAPAAPVNDAWAPRSAR